MSMNITLDLNGRIVRRIKVWNCHPEILPSATEDECPYQVMDDVTEEKFFIVHRRSDGAAVLAKLALNKIIDYETEIKFLGGRNE